jgi:hypothetical protein
MSHLKKKTFVRTNRHSWFRHVHPVEDYIQASQATSEMRVSSKRKTTTGDRNRPPWPKFVNMMMQSHVPEHQHQLRHISYEVQSVLLRETSCSLLRLGFRYWLTVAKTYCIALLSHNERTAERTVERTYC